MKSVYALLVSVNSYQAPLRPLRGCRNDVDSALAHLSTRIAPEYELSVLELHEEQATRAAIVAGFRAHLGLAGPEDTALFWFSGHGSLVPVPPELAGTEPTGMMQTLVCHDSRSGGIPDLLDKELGVLVAGVARREAHVVVVLDCCHADSGTREADGPAVRAAPALTAPPPLDQLLPELRSGAGQASRGAAPTQPADVDHVLLAACHSNQRAYEIGTAEGHRGLFSLALLTQFGRLGPTATCRELMAGARRFVEDVLPMQQPVLSPAGEDLADRPFLGGAPRAATVATTMRYLRGRWEIDAGACHGLTGGDAGAAVVGVYGTDPVREAQVVDVLADRAVVEPMGWRPDPAAVYHVILTALPMPATPVGIGGPGQDARTAAVLVDAVRTAGPGGRPSPYVRPVAADDWSAQSPLRLDISHPGLARILDAGGGPLAPPAPVSSRREALQVVADLEHIARWRTVRALDNPLSALAGAVRIEFVVGAPDSLRPAQDGRPETDPAGAVRLAYRPGASSWAPPEVLIRLRNTTDRELYCVLLDLTDRFRIHADLFPGAWVGPNYTAIAAGGDPVEFSLPVGRPVTPGTSGRDWLKLLVAEQAFSSASFDLPALGEPAPATDHGEHRGLGGILERLGLGVRHRERGAPPSSARDWAAETIAVVTRVPD